MKIFQLILISLFLFSSSIWAQKPDLSTPKQYEIASVTIVGVKYFQPGPIINKTGLKIGNKITIPGPEIAQAIDGAKNYQRAAELLRGLLFIDKFAIELDDAIAALA